RRQPAVRRQARGLPGARDVLSAAGRRPQAALRGVDRLSVERRSAAAEADRPAGNSPNAALQRRAGLPPLGAPAGRPRRAHPRPGDKMSPPVDTVASHRAMMLPSRHYESEHTKFIRELMAKHPSLLQKQREGRSIWWDKTPRELAEEHRMDEGRVPQSP